MVFNLHTIMFPFKEDLSARQKNISNWNNTCEYIVLHHTASIWDWNIKVLLGETARQVSCFTLIRQNWDAIKLSDPKNITWHAGESSWKWKKWLNKYSIWIEVEWPSFTEAQRKTVFWLVQHLMAVFKIPKENVITHAMIAPGRKTDIHPEFFPNWYDAWISKLVPKEWK